jgi:hypothetical protein
MSSVVIHGVIINNRPRHSRERRDFLGGHNFPFKGGTINYPRKMIRLSQHAPPSFGKIKYGGYRRTYFPPTDFLAQYMRNNMGINESAGIILPPYFI